MIITFSNGFSTAKVDNSGQSFNDILKKISRKKTGSNAFHKALDHRNNFIGWAVNQISFTDIKEIKLEKISNFRHGKNVGKFLNYFGEPLIRQKLLEAALIHGVHVVEQSSPFRSQRCSCCGYVSNKNRVKEMFRCKRCSFQADADYNASCNHEQVLPSSSFLFYSLRKYKEFFWKAEGFFTLEGLEISVLDTKKVNRSESNN